MGNRTHTTRHLQPAKLHPGICELYSRRSTLQRNHKQCPRKEQSKRLPHDFKRWKFFRASEPDELWQIDFKGPFSVQGKKYWFLVCIDDYSRFIIAAEYLTMSWLRLKQWLFWRGRRGFRRLFCLIMTRSLRSNGKTGVVSMGWRLSLLIHLILRTRAKLNDASKTSIETSLIYCAGSLDGSKVK